MNRNGLVKIGKRVFNNFKSRILIICINTSTAMCNRVGRKTTKWSERSAIIAVFGREKTRKKN